MSDADPEEYRKYAEMSALGGNFDEYEDLFAKYGKTLDDPMDAVFAARGGKAREVDRLAAERQGVLGLGMQGRYDELMGARAQMARNRQAQLALLDAISQRESAVPYLQTASLNQVMDRLSRLHDPRARLEGIRRGAALMAAQMAGQRVAEETGREAGLVGGAAGIRGQDLRTAGIEQQELGRQIQNQLAKEQLAARYAQEGERRLAAAAAAELDLAAIQAGQKGGINFWDHVFPGLVQTGAALGGMAASGSNTPPAQPFQSEYAPPRPMQLETGTGLGEAWTDWYNQQLNR